jgi:hypothetical protein
MKVDIQSQNFDYYFYNQLDAVAEEGRQKLPLDISQTLWRKDNKVNKSNIKWFNIIQRLFILWKATRKDVFIVVVDEKKGLNPDEFCAWLKANRKKDYEKETEGLTCNALFVLANKELGETFSYLNRVSHSAMYNYFSKVKGLEENKVSQFSKNMRLIAKMVRAWEMQKKIWTTAANISMAEFYVLINLYVEGEMPGARIYQKDFKRAFHSGTTKIKLAFGSLQDRGLIEKIGLTRGATMRITGLGVELINNILTKYSHL